MSGRRTSSSKALKRRRRSFVSNTRSNGPTACGSSLTSLFRSTTTGSSQRSRTRLNDARPRFGSDTKPTVGKRFATSSRDPSVELLSTTVTRHGTGGCRAASITLGRHSSSRRASVIVENQNVRPIDRQGLHPSRKAAHPATLIDRTRMRHDLRLRHGSCAVAGCVPYDVTRLRSTPTPSRRRPGLPRIRPPERVGFAMWCVK